MTFPFALPLPRRATYAAWNPSDKASGVALTNNNRTMTVTSSGLESVRSILGKASGRWYAELTMNNVGNQPLVGIAGSSSSMTNYPGSGSDAYTYSSVDGNYYNNGPAGAYGASYTTNDVIGIAVDFVNLRLYFRKNGTWQNSGDPVGVSGGITIGAGTYYLISGDGASGTVTGQCTLNAGQAAFSHAPPTGFRSWHVYQ